MTFVPSSKARRLARQMNMGLDEIEIRQTTEYGELVATAPVDPIHACGRS